jgi:hypothetical protein
MESNMNNFDDLFREGLANHSEIPPARVWEKLEKQLDTRAVAGGRSWLWYAGFASVALMLGGAGWKALHKEPTNVAAMPATVAVVAVPNVAIDGDAIADDNAMKEAVQTLPSKMKYNHKAEANNSNEESHAAKDEVLTPFGNVPATGTSVHSYDDFDERAVATTSNMLKSDDAHRNTGYRIHKIQKHHLKAAEMVPVGGIPQPESTEVKVTVGKPVSMSGKRQIVNTQGIESARMAERATKRAPANGQPAALMPAAGSSNTTLVQDLPTSVAEPATQVRESVAAPETNGAEDADATSMPVTTRPAPVSVTRPRTVAQASVTGYKPSTGGARLAEKDSMQNNEQEDPNENARPRGIRGIFRRVLGQ